MNEHFYFPKQKANINKGYFLRILCIAFFACISICPGELFAQNTGFEALPATSPPNNWSAVTGTWVIETNPANVRTGAQSMSITDPAATGTTGGTTNPFYTSPGGEYLIAIGWGKASNATNGLFHLGYRSGTTNTLNPSSTSSGQPANLNDVSWSRIISVSSTAPAAGNYGVSLRAFRSATSPSTTIYMDDIILYSSASNVPDLSAPNPGSNVFVSGTNISWINGVDNGSPASGIGGVVIIRGDGALLPAPVLNDQAMYSPTGGASGVSSFVDGGITWTVVGNITDDATTSFNDGSASGGPYTYVVYMRDKAYNYSTGVVSQPPSPCTNPPVAGMAESSATGAVCNGSSVTLNLSGGSFGLGQTYQWQSSSTIGGAYTNISGVQNSPAYIINPTSTGFYRCEIVCSGGTAVYSDTIEVEVSTGYTGNFTINSGLPTGGANYNTIAEAIAALSCGITGPVVFNFNNDTYIGSIDLSNLQGLSEVNTITFNGNGSTVMDTLTAGKPDYILRLNNVSYITFDNFRFIADPLSTQGVVISLTDAHYNTIRNSVIEGDQSATGTTRAAIVISGSSASTTTATSASYNTFENNDISGGYYGIRLNGTTATRNVLGNRFINNIVRDFYGYGIYNLAGDSTQIVGNDIHRLNRPGSATITTGYGIYYTTNSKKGLISNNAIHDIVPSGVTTGSYAIYFTTNDAPAGEENWVVNNLIYNNVSNGANYGIYNSGSDGVFSYYNTVSFDNFGATAGLAYGLYQTTAAQRIENKNNIVYINKGGSGAKYALYYATTTSGIASDNNALYVNTAVAGTGVKNIGYWGAAFVSMANWQAANSGAFDQASVNADPFFADPANDNFKPGNLLVNNIATPINGITHDLFGTLRNITNPDPGAVEFTIYPNDIGVIGLESLAGNCTGTHDVKARIKNLGSNAITDFVVNWSVNGSVQSPVTWGPGTLNINEDALITLGSFAFTSNVAYDIEVWTSAPNNTVDGFTSNDTLLTENVKTGLSGTVTVGPAGADYQTIVAAINDINTYGVCGPILIDVDPLGGPYTEQIKIANIPGLSETNTIYLKGNGSEINYVSTTTANRAAIYLDAAKHITIDSFIINGALNNSASEYTWGIYASSGSDSNTIINNRINLSNNSSSLNYSGIVFSGSATSATTAGLFKFNRIENNIIDGGYYGIIFFGTALSAPQSIGNEIRNNVLKNAYSRAISVSYADSTQITYNDISYQERASVFGTANYSIYIQGGTTAPVNNTFINGNTIHDLFTQDKAATTATYGIYVTGADATTGKENVIANNVIYNIDNNGGNYGIYNTAGDGWLIYHNSVSVHNMDATAGTARGIYIAGLVTNNIINNNALHIVKGGPDFKAAVTYADSNALIISDYNALFTGGVVAVYVGSYGGTAYGSLAGYQNASGLDPNSFALDPEFTNRMY